MGNVFFKLGFVNECVQAQQRALELMSEDSKVSLQEPSFMTPVTKEELHFHVISFLVVSNLELSQIAKAETLCRKMEKLKTWDQSINFNRFILRCLICLSQNKGLNL